MEQDRSKKVYEEPQICSYNEGEFMIGTVSAQTCTGGLQGPSTTLFGPSSSSLISACW